MYSLVEHFCQISPRSDLKRRVWFPPFRCRTAVAVSPFRCAVVTFRCTVAVLPFRSYRCRCAVCMRTELRETSFRIRRDEVTRTLIDCATTTERQIPLCRCRHNGIFHVCNVILTALTEFLRNFPYGNGETATEWWKQGISS